jgi:NADH-quinone oxidoreductase subunit L
MSRLFVLTFRGTERFREVTNGHDPHESSWVMTTPLVVLAALSVLGGMLDLPWVHHDSLTNFLSSTFGYVAPSVAQSTLSQYGLAAVDTAAALIGLAVAFTIWRARSDDNKLTPAFFEHVWYWDDFYDATIGRPLEKLAVFSDAVVEDEVIDGGVMGLAEGIRRSSEGVRKIQSGFVRHYALAMALGMAVIVVYLVARVG